MSKRFHQYGFYRDKTENTTWYHHPTAIYTHNELSQGTGLTDLQEVKC